MPAPEYTLWNIGLGEDLAENIAALLEEPCRILSLDPADVAGQATGETPFLVCCRASLWPKAMAAAGQDCELLLHLPLLLVLDQEEDARTVNQVLSWGAMDVARFPLDRDRIIRTLRKASELAVLRQDLTAMTREIFLQREMLVYKTEALTFLNGFLNASANERTPAGLLRAAGKSLHALFPMLALQLVLREGHGPFGNSALYLTMPEGHPAVASWRSALLPLAGSSHPSIYHLPDVGPRVALPEDGHPINLPLMEGADKIGTLVVLTSLERNLGRDQAQALEAAMRHLALLVPPVFRLPCEREAAQAARARVSQSLPHTVSLN